VSKHTNILIMGPLEGEERGRENIRRINCWIPQTSWKILIYASKRHSPVRINTKRSTHYCQTTKSQRQSFAKKQNAVFHHIRGDTFRPTEWRQWIDIFEVLKIQVNQKFYIQWFLPFKNGGKTKIAPDKQRKVV
jgi:hypothetical protein